MDHFYDFERPIISLEKKISELRQISQKDKIDFSDEIGALERKLTKLIENIYADLSPWQRVQLSRHPMRPYAKDYLKLTFHDFIELHGDRKFQDDESIMGGLAYIDKQPVVVIGQEKGRGTKEKMRRNFGMVKPEGYRKALRLMEMAEQFQLPIVTLVDTPGAYPGIDAEERGQSQAIADNIMKMFHLEVPVITVVIGEGGSGGALALAVADVVLMMELATYSVISPESCASILWSDSTKSEQAAKVLKLTAPDVKALGVVDDLVAEPRGGAHRDHEKAAELLGKAISANLKKLQQSSGKELVRQRINRFRKIGQKAILQSGVEASK